MSACPSYKRFVLFVADACTGQIFFCSFFTSVCTISHMLVHHHPGYCFADQFSKGDDRRPWQRLDMANGTVGLVVWAGGWACLAAIPRCF